MTICFKHSVVASCGCYLGCYGDARDCCSLLEPRRWKYL